MFPLHYQFIGCSDIFLNGKRKKCVAGLIVIIRLASYQSFLNILYICISQQYFPDVNYT